MRLVRFLETAIAGTVVTAVLALFAALGWWVAAIGWIVVVLLLAGFAYLLHVMGPF